MAKQTILTCDALSGCKQQARTFRVWREGDSTAYSIDLCEEHAQPLLDVLTNGTEAPLPSKPRVRMEVTALKPTAKTLPLKKRN